ncbi:DnaD domain protein [Lacticaseibacillus saniviri]|uniref:DnaD domain protein n=1 Tax=Lacticaseibacillus saniviri TaxID=931533 RepID=UPI001CDC06C9|nr:DnaD domain protein [Lacticaseibacillus saniviri]
MSLCFEGSYTVSDLDAFMAAGSTSVSNLILEHFNQTGLTINELVVYLYLSYWQQNHQEAPDLATIANLTQLSQADLFAVINNLIQKKAIQLTSTVNHAGQTSDHYDLSPLLIQLLGTQTAEASQPEPAQGSSLFSMVEVEFGRPLSPIEQQTIRAWLEEDHYAPEMIQLALREAVLNQAYSLRYMDRVLINWEKRHLTTPQQVQADKDRQNGL